MAGAWLWWRRRPCHFLRPCPFHLVPSESAHAAVHRGLRDGEMERNSIKGREERRGEERRGEEGQCDWCGRGRQFCVGLMDASDVI